MTDAPVADRPTVHRPAAATAPVDRWWWCIGAAVAVALVLRVVWGLWVDHPPQGFYDPARYVGYGREIADGNGMIEPLTGRPTAYYPPGYPWFVGIATWSGRPFTDNAVTAVVLVQAVLGAATVALGALVARAVAGRRAGVVAAVGLAVYPNLVYHSGAVLGETLYNFLFLGFLAVAATARWPQGLTTRRLLAAGALLGLAVMVRPISLAVVPVVALAWWMATRDGRFVRRATLLLLATVAGCIVPWTIRNAARMDAFVPISTNTGDNLCIGYADGANGAFHPRAACDTRASLLDGPSGEVAADKEKQQTALDAIRDHPGRQPGQVWKRFWYMWIRDGDHDGVLAVQSYRSDRFLGIRTEANLARGADIAYWLLVPVGLLGLAALVRRRRGLDLLLVGSAVATALVPLAFFGDSRFKVPVIPLLIIIAATLAGRPWRSARSPRPPLREEVTTVAQA
ncbi:MAG: glycosyl transferase [Acidimicrobiales bacterium]|nr:glycosyl transferase [Acidimicrobiales bacterium]